MALIDVSELMGDPDFIDIVTLKRRTSTVNSYGENTVASTSSSVYMVVQPASPDDLQRLPDSVRRRDAIKVWYTGTLSADALNVYPDVITWGGRDYQVASTEPYGNWGAGYTQAICTLIEAST